MEGREKFENAAAAATVWNVEIEWGGSQTFKTSALGPDAITALSSHLIGTLADFAYSSDHAPHNGPLTIRMRRQEPGAAE